MAGAIKGISKFCQQKKSLVKMLSELEGRDAPCTQTVEFFNGEEEILFAVLLQNSMHPKNSDRREAITDGSYMEI